MGSPDLVVVWRVTERCNLGCAFCGYSRHIRRRRATADPRQILAFGALLGEYQAAAGRTVRVSWLGGEPLTWPPLVELAKVFRSAYQLRLGVTTNGVPLARAAMREHLVAVYDEVTVSIDGRGEFHDRCRDAPGLYGELRRSIAELRRQIDRAHSPLVLRVNTVLMRGNVAALEGLCRELAGWGVRELTFNQLGGNDRPEFYPENRLLPGQVEWLRRELPGLRRRMAALGLVVRGGDRYLERMACTARGVHIPVADCGPGQTFQFVNEEGVVSPCSFTSAGYGVPLDSLTSPADLERLPLVFAERKRQQALAPCGDCHSTQVFEKFR
jgi:MoaA/NifB/PqqE/SkfB family radical SAM enzyme